jgi:hypothetical protein
MHIKGELHNLGQNPSKDYSFLASTLLGDFKELPLFMVIHCAKSLK